MTICSLVVFAQAAQTGSVEEKLLQIEGVEIHARDPSGKMVVTIDHPDRTHCSESIMEMSRMAGVLSTALVYEYHE
ncbi:MAG: chaperone NapD [Hyphomicrobiales bacterium]